MSVAFFEIICEIQVTESRGVKVYNVSTGKTLPQWLSEKVASDCCLTFFFLAEHVVTRGFLQKRKSLRKDEEYKSRIELIQVT